MVSAGQPLSVVQRATPWLAATHAATAARQATGIDVRRRGARRTFSSRRALPAGRPCEVPACHLGGANYQKAGQAFLDLDMRATNECREEVETNRRDDEKIVSQVAVELSCFASSIAALNLDELGHLGIVMDSEADREPLHFGHTPLSESRHCSGRGSPWKR